MEEKDGVGVGELDHVRFELKGLKRSCSNNRVK